MPIDFIPALFRPGRDRLRSVEDGLSDSTLQPPPVTAPRPTALAVNDKLSNFRHMVGIHSTNSLDPSNNLHFNGRAAPNLGIYNRVIKREKAAKRGYKFASIGINTCLGVQIIVAAALTAMGAANSNHVGVTAFGAINTVIAGILTYLKGSGLPNRIRYYENEWKKVREYIEQRERDFSRPDCALDVYQVVRVIEGTVGDIRNRAAFTNPQIPRIQDVTGYENKLKELESKYGHRVSGFLQGLAEKEEKKLEHLEKGLEAANTRVVEGGRSLEKDIEARGLRVVEGGRNLENDIEAMGSRVVDLGRDIEKGAERQRSNVARVGGDMEDEIQVHGQGLKY